MWAHAVVVGPPGVENLAGLWQRYEQRLVQALVAQPAYEALREGVLLRLAGRNVVPVNPARCVHFRIAMLVSSVPLSETQLLGRPRRAISVSSSRATRAPDSDVSGISARLSRVKSSTIARMRKRRPSVKLSDTKSRDYRSVGHSAA